MRLFDLSLFAVLQVDLPHVLSDDKKFSRRGREFRSVLHSSCFGMPRVMRSCEVGAIHLPGEPGPKKHRLGQNVYTSQYIL